ncbi:MAG: PilZ domain-containing protein [Tepidisphaeraceae bacterium]
MGMFSDEFPFARREAEAEEQNQVPVVEAQPLAADAFPDDFPFTTREAATPDSAAETRPASSASSIFPPGFPFAEPDVVSVVQAAPAMTEARAAHDAPVEAITSSVEAPVPAPAPTAPLPFKDRRRSPRQRMNAKATLRVDNVGGNPLAVEIDNLSLLGVRFRADRPLLLNDKANIRLEVGPLKWNARLRVINCLEGAGRTFTIGCEFVGNELARGRAAA